MGFFDKALERARKVGAPLCLGLDPRDESVERFSHSGLYTMLYDRYVRNLHMEGFRSLAADSVYVKLKLYCLHLLESTAEHVCCVKPNLAFFIAQGAEGVQVSKKGNLSALELAERFNERALHSVYHGDVVWSPFMASMQHRYEIESLHVLCLWKNLDSMMCL